MIIASATVRVASTVEPHKDYHRRFKGKDEEEDISILGLNRDALTVVPTPRSHEVRAVHANDDYE